MFKDMLSIVDACSECSLVLKHHDAADGPTFFAIIIVGMLVATAASLTELHYSPPLWLHALLWIPFTLVGCIACLRMVKTILITVEFRLEQLKGNNHG
ncbi:DUF983 domain-containing protein [Methylocystis sp.]|uniref:DUF983 domain-containing protein n=1 Tax=Methylocystis sp. TaxID=1911079 RepID=UPI003DA1DD9F